MFYSLTILFILLACTSVSSGPVQSSGSDQEADSDQHVHAVAGDLDALLNIIKPTPKHPKDISIPVYIENKEEEEQILPPGSVEKQLKENMETFDSLHKALQDLSNQNTKVVGDGQDSEVCDNSIAGSADCVKSTTENIVEPVKDDSGSGLFSFLFSFFG